MNFYPHRTVEEQAERLPEELREAYKNSQIDRIIIFDGKETIELTGYAEYSYLDEKSYKTQPVRTQDGAIQEIEEYATFLTPRLVIKYSMMGIDDYRSLMKMLKRRNGYIVKCYDVVEDKIVKNEMYVATPSMPRIYQQFLIAMGIQEYNIELIGTNGRSTMSCNFNGQPMKVVFGQTWREFCNSEYNTNGAFFITDSNKVARLSSSSIVYKDRSRAVAPDDYIFQDGAYTA